MNKTKIENIVEELALPIIDEFEYEFVDVELVMESKEWYLRVYIDKDGGVTLDDCAKVSRKLSDKLDEVDPISFSYYLEVSSPGIDRPLKKEKDFVKFNGREIKVKLYKALDGKKVINGILKGMENNTILLEVNGQEIRIDRDLVSSVRLKAFN